MLRAVLLLLAARLVASLKLPLPFPSTHVSPDKPPQRALLPPLSPSAPLPLLPQLGAPFPQTVAFSIQAPPPHAASVQLLCVRRVGTACPPAPARPAKPLASGSVVFEFEVAFAEPAEQWEAALASDAAEGVELLAWATPLAAPAPQPPVLGAPRPLALGAPQLLPLGAPQPLTLGAPQPLALGVPVDASVNWGAWRYYELNLTNAALAAGGRLDISVVRTWGDPDLYVALWGRLPTSQPGGAQYSSASVGASDQVVIASSDAPAAAYCGAPGGTCQVLIGVVGGLLGGVFRLTAVLGDASTPLTSGVPLPASITNPGSYNFYSLPSASPAAAGARFTFSLTPTSGDPDMFIGSTVRPGQTLPRGSDPSTFCWVSSGVGGGAVEVEPNDPTGCYCAGPACTYFVGVQASGGAGTSYTLVATEAVPGSNSSSRLLDGVPELGILAVGEVAYYSLSLPPQRAPTPRRRVEVSVTPLWGDPDLYIAFPPTLPGPSKNNSYESLNAAGPEDIVMRDGDPTWYCPDWSQRCDITIAVYGYSACIYSVQASAGRPTVLSPGVPQSGEVDAGGGFYTYYTFQANNTASEVVLLSLTPTMGDPDMYVSTSVTGVLPTNAPGSYFWASSGLGAEVVSVDAAGDGHSCFRSPSAPGSPPCVYTVGVMAYGGAPAAFSITARTRDGSPVRLSPGVPVEGAVEALGYNRYTAQYDPRLGYLEVTVTPTSGDPDLYISLGAAIPNRTVAMYASTAGSGDEDVLITPTDPQFLGSTCSTRPLSACYANVAVYGFPSAAVGTYAITASSGLRMLESGASTVGQTRAGGTFSYFLFEVAGGGALTPITIAVAPLCAGGCDPDV